MPYDAPRECPYCHQLADRAHIAAHRPSPHQRGYDAGWNRSRGKALKGARCARCGSRENLQRNHKVPQSMGGTDDPENLEWLCASCHGKYGLRSNSRRRQG